MATTKSYTDLEQSKKLAEIVPIESADMIYIMYRNGEKPQNGDENLSTVYESNEHKWYWIDIIDEAWNMRIGEDIPCWSLAALFKVIPQEILDGEYIVNITEGRDNRWILTYDHYENRNHSYYGLSTGADNLVDACVAMIEKLYEHKML